jgi:hypothetical protein
MAKFRHFCLFLNCWRSVLPVRWCFVTPNHEKVLFIPNFLLFTKFQSKIGFPPTLESDNVPMQMRPTLLFYSVQAKIHVDTQSTFAKP